MEPAGLMKENRKFRFFIIFFLFFFSFSLSFSTFAAYAYAATGSFSFPGFVQQTAPTAKSQDAQVKAQPDKQPEKIIPAPQNIKESAAIYVFLGWMWLSIVVLIYFLRLKIKEADRLYMIRFFSSERK
jgi:hypothetical protein